MKTAQDGASGERTLQKKSSEVQSAIQISATTVRPRNVDLPILKIALGLLADGVVQNVEKWVVDVVEVRHGCHLGLYYTLVSYRWSKYSRLRS